MGLGRRALAQSVFHSIGIGNEEKRGSFGLDMDPLAERTYSHGRSVGCYLDWDNGAIGDRGATGHCARLIGNPVASFIPLPRFEYHFVVKGEFTWPKAIK
jgi:hypothetical protein